MAPRSSKPKSGILPPRSLRKKSRNLTKSETAALYLGILGLIIALVIGALAEAGVVSMSAAQVMLGGAWVIAVVGAALVEIFSGRPRKRVLSLSLMLRKKKWQFTLDTANIRP